MPILPFHSATVLQQQGVNQIDWAIATDAQSMGNSGWLEVLERMPVKNFYAYAASKGTVLARKRWRRRCKHVKEATNF
jgi:competence protein ComEC